MKKIFIVLLITSLFLTSCSTRTHNINRYGSFTNDKYYLECNLEMFPKKIKENWTVLDYQFWNRVMIWEDAYIYVDICFNNEEEYNTELNRILDIKGSYYFSTDIFVENMEDFNYTAYVLDQSHLNWQYVLTIPNENRIIYVFLQSASVDNISFSKEYLPKDYKFGTEVDSIMESFD